MLPSCAVNGNIKTRLPVLVATAILLRMTMHLCLLNHCCSRHACIAICWMCMLPLCRGVSVFLLVVVLYTSIPAWRNVEMENMAEFYFEGDLVRAVRI